MGTKKSINKSAKNTFIYSEDTTEQLRKISYGVPRHIRKFWQLLFQIHVKIARNSAVSINILAKTFLEDQLNRVLYFMKNSVCVPRHEFWLNLYYRSQWQKKTLHGFLRLVNPPVQLTRWAHMHHFLYVCCIFTRTDFNLCMGLRDMNQLLLSWSLKPNLSFHCNHFIEVQVL